jgi:hypothetical protein
MLFKSLFASSVLAFTAVSAQITTGLLGNASVVNDNPVGPSYAANLPVNGTVTGKVTFTANTNGTGVSMTVSFKGFKGKTGPFIYHVHDQPVPASGNCNGTLAHLDPYQRGEAPPCNKPFPQTCQVGDLAGKHGSIPDANGAIIEFHDSYTDLYVSSKPGIGAFAGNRSVVVHSAGGVRIACANFELVSNVPSGPSVSTQSTGNSASAFGVSSVVAFGSLFLAVAAFAL